MLLTEAYWYGMLMLMIQVLVGTPNADMTRRCLLLAMVHSYCPMVLLTTVTYYVHTAYKVLAYCYVILPHGTNKDIDQTDLHRSEPSSLT